MRTIFTRLLYELGERRDTMLLTIISKDGPAPRGVGAQMLVGREGRLIGSIGGGAVEHHMEQMAIELLKEGRSARHDVPLHQMPVGDIGMICGGDVSVWSQAFDADDADLSMLASRIVSRLSKDEGGWFVQYLDGRAPALLDRLDDPRASVDGAGPPTAIGDGHILTDAYFAMPLPRRSRAVIFGGGHCAMALAPLLDQVGFSVVVMDDRPDHAVPSRFPQAERVVCGDYAKISNVLTLSPSDYLVVMTHGHAHDIDVLDQVLREPSAYVGVIGSRSKRAFVEERLREAGIEEAIIRSVHSPIGVAIKAATPEEIAVSIAAEMIYERALLR